ncbi:MAG: DNA translocase FtsK [Deltaproteobacteria bacterium]|nr:DNA translocase FtsK [Deltaproteobacteria bacterium]
MSVPLFATRRIAGNLPCEVAAARTAEPEKAAFRRGREAAALLLIASAVYVALALSSFSKNPDMPEIQGANWVGPVGASIAGFLVSAIGVVAWAAPVELVVMALPLFRNRPSIASVARIGGDLVVIFILAALAHVSMPDAHAFGAMTAAGLVGELFGELMRSLFSTVGSYIIGLTAVGLILIARASFSFIALARRASSGTGVAAHTAAAGLRSIGQAWSAARDLERRRADQDGVSIPIDTSRADRAILAAIDEDVSTARKQAESKVSQDELAISLASSDDTPDAAPDLEVASAGDRAPKDKRRALGPHDEVEPEAESEDAAQVVAAAVTDTVEAEEDAAVPGDGEDAEPPKVRKRARKPSGPTIVDTSDASVVEKASNARVPVAAASTFQLPAFELLEEGKNERLVVDDEMQAQLNDNARQLVTTLSHYGVSGQVREILPGPTVTTYELEPEPGTKVSKIASLADDLALNLGCQVRIIAPIPGKKRVGFEVPNRSRRPVNLRELIEDRRFQEIKAPLPIVLGRDIVGAPYYADLSSMPHVLVAGATGAGKSVGLNVMLISLLYRRTPEDLRLLMIDPKVVELQSFDRMPHMLLPVVTDTKQAVNALKWAVDEMERRYQLLANAGTKNISTYNAWVERVHRGEVPGFSTPKTMVTTAPDGSILEVGPAREPPKLPDKLPFIVIVVDEFADLMMQQGKDVEASIARLAQKARAAGMHVILATQRPSVDVITGMIKANFPTRIAFKVTQRIDSRTILDEQGAEHLLGRGDMLVKMNGTNDIRRVQCPFVSEEEVERVTTFLRRQGEPTYDESILAARDEGMDEDAGEQEADSKFDEAVQVVRETRRCSTSWVQRKLNIGYNRAAKIVEMMEKRGLVGPPNGAREREVLLEP